MPMWCVAPLEINEWNSLGQGYNRPIGCSVEKAPHATFNFNFLENVVVNLQRAFTLKRSLDYALLMNRTVIFETGHCLTGRLEKENYYFWK